MVRVLARPKRIYSFTNLAKTLSTFHYFPFFNSHRIEGAEPTYNLANNTFKVFECKKPVHLKHGVIPELQVAYETYGELNKDNSNAILIFTGLSANSHAKSSEVKPFLTIIIHQTLILNFQNHSQTQIQAGGRNSSAKNVQSTRKSFSLFAATTSARASAPPGRQA